MTDLEMVPNASCVAIGGYGLLIEGEVGSGKSSLALALIDRGAVLVGDDGIALERRGDALWALPPPNITGSLHVRGVGIFDMPCAAAQLSLSLWLEQKMNYTVLPVPRDRMLEGIVLPQLSLRGDDPYLPLRAESALAKYGLPLAGTMV